MKNKRKPLSLIPIIGGGLLLAAALSLALYNLWDSRRAESYTAETVSQLLELLPESAAQGEPLTAKTAETPEAPAPSPTAEPTPEPPESVNLTLPVGIDNYMQYVEMELPGAGPGGTGDGQSMPTKTVNGLTFSCVLEIPRLNLTLPILANYNYDQLAYCPGRYVGSVYENDMVICAHNYDGHFGRLHKLNPGDEVKLTDMEGSVFSYRVSQVEVLNPYAKAEMTTADGWDLTLFTCTVGGQSRVTVRCSRES